MEEASDSKTVPRSRKAEDRITKETYDGRAHPGNKITDPTEKI
jgi:hypothetical protein